MSGVYIPGMEMPKSCLLCPFCVPEADEENGDICIISGQFPLTNKEERSVECPLVLVPDHGRLIDANELLERTDYIEAEFGHIHEEIRDMPTIIPAEEGET